MTVVLGVMPAGLGVVMLGMAGVTVGAVRVMRRLLVVAGLVVLGGFAVVARRVLVMLGCLVVMLDTCVVAHGALPVWRMKSVILAHEPDTMLTAARQLCCGCSSILRAVSLLLPFMAGSRGWAPGAPKASPAAHHVSGG